MFLLFSWMFNFSEPARESRDEHFAGNWNGSSRGEPVRSVENSS